MKGGNFVRVKEKREKVKKSENRDREKEVQREILKKQEEGKVVFDFVILMENLSYSLESGIS